MDCTRFVFDIRVLQSSQNSNVSRNTRKPLAEHKLRNPDLERDCDKLRKPDPGPIASVLKYVNKSSIEIKMRTYKKSLEKSVHSTTWLFDVLKSRTQFQRGHTARTSSKNIHCTLLRQNLRRQTLTAVGIRERCNNVQVVHRCGGGAFEESKRSQNVSWEKMVIRFNRRRSANDQFHACERSSDP